jgi:hypothetical protein
MSATTKNFTGQHLDGTGLLFYNARYYDPTIGRFLSADTIVPGSDPLTVWPSDGTATPMWGNGGKANGSQNPQELNRYSYVNNNPLKYTDPTGHWVWIAAAAGVGAVVNVGATFLISYATTGKPPSAGAVVGAALSGAATGALTAMGGSLVAGFAAKRAIGEVGKFAMNAGASALASVATDAVASALSKPIDAMQELITGKKPGETNADPLKAVISGGVSGLSWFAGDLDGMGDLSSANRTMTSPTPPKYEWSKSLWNEYYAQQARRGSNAKMIAVNIAISVGVSVGAGAITDYTRNCWASRQSCFGR